MDNNMLKMNDSAIKIQRMYRNAGKLPGDNLEYDYVMNKNQWVRFYMLNYPNKFLLTLPEDMKRTLAMFGKEIIIPENKSRKDTLRFLLREDISVDDIVANGW